MAIITPSQILTTTISPTPHFQQQQLQQHIYYDGYGDPVDDPDMIAILKMEEEGREQGVR